MLGFSPSDGMARQSCLVRAPGVVSESLATTKETTRFSAYQQCAGAISPARAHLDGGAGMGIGALLLDGKLRGVMARA